MSLFESNLIPLKKLLLDAGATIDGVKTNEIANWLKSKLDEKKASVEKADYIQDIIIKRNISSVLHFTPLGNVENIMRHGLIPREYLELNILKLDSAPLFPDGDRKDKRPDCFCASVSWPNYRMLHSKMLRGQFKNEEWVIIEFGSVVLHELDFAFYRTNAAKLESKRRGEDKFEDLFYDREFRSKLGIGDEFTTDPEAECMCGGRIPPEQIKAIYLRNIPKMSKSNYRYLTNLVKQKLIKQGLIKQMPELFEARLDFKYWQ